MVTSANFSYRVDENNVELGLRIDNYLLTRSVEEQMRALENAGVVRAGWLARECR